ncbi:MAG: hypothetical protein M1823_000288 [Watsoniomyces obsoletus]|nr:MAG: hypothetical protein M1823_000288 [Watsoniomyces obsoletus]
MSQYSEACCTVPPVVAKDYSAKGDYITVDDMKTYVVGPQDAKAGILFIYDIFGHVPQTLQGADILAYGNQERPHQVFMPDFFDGKPADFSWYPPDNDEKKQKLGAFFQGPASGQKVAPRIIKVAGLLSEKYPNIQSWGIVGFCWGGKMVSITSGEGTPFKVAAECHPAMLDPEDAGEITIPLIMLASKDEGAETVKAFQEKLKVKNHVERFGDQIHGWMAARGNLEDPKVKTEYERGYKTLLTFFHENL